MIDDAARVQNDGIADLTVGTDQNAGGDDAIAAKGHVGGQIGGRMNCIDQLKPKGRKSISEFASSIGSDCRYPTAFMWPVLLLRNDGCYVHS